MNDYTIDSLLLCPTPQAWLDHALKNIPLLLVDHAHCEKKAAATALNLIYRYSDQPILLSKMSKLAREELKHFEQVLKLIADRGERFYDLSPGSYAATLRQHVIAHEPKKRIDLLILGALIEARSCERFRLLSGYLEENLAQFYRKLYLAEARHFEEYLQLAWKYAQEDISARIQFFAEQEAAFIQQHDEIFRFHSGIPN